MPSYHKILSLLITLCSGMANAQTFEQIHLKDGSVLEGYICEQAPGKTISVQTTKATLKANTDTLLSSSERQVMVSELPSEWKKWVMAQPTSISQVALSNLQFKNSSYSDVLITENGPIIEFVSLSNRVYKFPWNQVAKTVKQPRPEGVVSGLKDVIILKDGTRKVGFVTEQVPGKTIKLALNGDNASMLNSSLIDVMEYQPICDELNLIEQAPLLDRITLKDRENPVEGLITKRRMGKDLTITMADGNEEVFPLTNIFSYAKFKNPDYKVIIDRHLAKGQVVINGDEKDAWFAPLKSENGYFILDEASAVAKRGDEMTVEANLENPSDAIYLIKAYRKEIPIQGLKRTVARDVFTYQDLVELALPIERTQTPLGNTKVTFKVTDPGDYVLSIQGYQGFIVIHVN